MKDFKKLAKLVKELDAQNIWAYMLEIATVIDGRGDLSESQKEDAYALASSEFENSEDSTIGANVFAEAAIETVLDEGYDGENMDEVHEIFNEKYDNLLN